jgi:uncharacterized protein involved in exopolysaccharide biosynthesis
LIKLEANGDASPNTDYVSRYREYKYQEALFELLSRQYEVARLDESRESGPLQVIDIATPPENKSKPKRAQTALAAAALTELLFALGILARHFLARTRKTRHTTN